jgi:hypothetical protein
MTSSGSLTIARQKRTSDWSAGGSEANDSSLHALGSRSGQKVARRSSTRAICADVRFRREKMPSMPVPTASATVRIVRGNDLKISGDVCPISAFSVGVGVARRGLSKSWSDSAGSENDRGCSPRRSASSVVFPEPGGQARRSQQVPRDVISKAATDERTVVALQMPPITRLDAPGDVVEDLTALQE